MTQYSLVEDFYLYVEVERSSEMYVTSYHTTLRHNHEYRKKTHLHKQMITTNNL